MFPSIESVLLTLVGIVLLLSIIGLLKVGLGALFTKREKYNARREVVNELLADITTRASLYQNPAVVQQIHLWRQDLLNRHAAGRSLGEILSATLDMHRSAVLKIQAAEHGQRMQQALNDHERLNHMVRFDVTVRHHDHSWSASSENISSVHPNLRAALDEHRYLTLNTTRMESAQP